MLARALGPSLSDDSITGPLQDPTLEIHDSNGMLIASDDNWQDTDADAIKATGLAPKNAKESAILATLPTGIYTAVVQGAGGSMGVALVEIYRLR